MLNSCTQVGNAPMNLADEMAAKIATINRQSADPRSDPDDMLRELDQRLRATLKDVRRTSNRPKPVEDLRSDDKLNEQFEDFSHTNHQEKPVEGLRSDEKLSEQPEDSAHTNHQAKPVEDLPRFIPRISDRLDDESSDRVRAVISQSKRRASRGFARYTVAICIGVAATLAWQSYGDVAKQIIAANAPALVSPEAKQMIAPKAPTAPSLDPMQVQQMVQSLASLRESVQQLASRQDSLATLTQTVDQLAAGQDQMVHKIDMLQSANQEILNKISASSRQLPAAPPRKPKPVPASSSRAPISSAPQSGEPIPPPQSGEPIPPEPIPLQAMPDHQ
jgi:hypothetical protein